MPFLEHGSSCHSLFHYQLDIEALSSSLKAKHCLSCWDIFIIIRRAAWLITKEKQLQQNRKLQNQLSQDAQHPRADKIILDPDVSLHWGNTSYTLVMKFYWMGPYIYSQLNEGRKSKFVAPVSSARPPSCHRLPISTWPRPERLTLQACVWHPCCADGWRANPAALDR